MATPRPVVELTIRGPVARSDLPGLYLRTCAALEGCRAGVLVCDVADVAVDTVAVDALARLGLGARRHGCQVMLRGAGPQLQALLELVGLGEVLPCG